ncbi:GD12924 [Drosophila simulans]|uniref:GD12924 n=1 Tax=Drosophila simulans TaxID=7240 RepID=B4NVI3_DROSI|nr:GD12924 [Drosophila simulans]
MITPQNPIGIFRGPCFSPAPWVATGACAKDLTTMTCPLYGHKLESAPCSPPYRCQDSNNGSGPWMQEAMVLSLAQKSTAATVAAAAGNVYLQSPNAVLPS